MASNLTGFLLIAAVLMMATVVLAGAASFTYWEDLTPQEKYDRAVVYTAVNLASGRDVVVHPQYGFEIPASLFTAGVTDG